MSSDLDLLQGTWSITTLEVEGQEMPSGMLAEGRIVVQGNRFTSTGMGAVYEGTLKLDIDTTPKQLNMQFDAGPEKGNINLGIYELDGDRWKICLATRGSVRPSTFVSTPGSGFAFETLTRGAVSLKKTRSRKKAAAKVNDADTSHATEFEGDWKMISGTMNGQPMDDSTVQWVKRVTRGNRTTVYAGPQVMMAMEFTSDASTSPHTIDYFNTAGSNKGKKQNGIYEFDGDLLKICVSSPDSPRPAEFKSVPGDGRTLTAWKRL